MSSDHSRSNRSRRSRVGSFHDNSPPETRQKPVQKAVQYIPGEHFSAWGERWTPIPPRRRSNKASTNSKPGVPAFTIEQGLYEFKLDSPPTPLTPPDPDDHAHAPFTSPVVYLHSSRPTKRKNRRTRKHTPHPTPSLQLSSTSTRVGTEELSIDTPTSGSFSTSLQAESVATGSASSGSSIPPEIVCYPVYDSPNLFVPIYNHYQHEVSAGNLTQRGSQVLPYDPMGYQSQVPLFPDTTLRWTPDDFFPSGPPPHYHQDPNQRDVDAMGHGTFHSYSHSPSVLEQTLYEAACSGAASKESV